MTSSYIHILRCPKKNLKEPLLKYVNLIYNDLGLKKNLCVSFKKIDQDWIVDELKNNEEVGNQEYNPDYKEHQITVSSTLFETPKTLFETIIHEIYHCYQFEKKIYLSEKRAYNAEKKYMKKYFVMFKKEIEENS